MHQPNELNIPYLPLRKDHQNSLFRATWTGVNIARTRKLKYAISSRNTICLTKCPAGKNTTNYGKTVTFATTASQFPIIYSLLMHLVLNLPN